MQRREEDFRKLGTQLSDIYLRLISCTGSPSGSPSVGNSIGIVINFSPVEDLHRFGTQFSDIYLRLISCTGSPSGSPSVGNFSWNQNESFTCSFNYTSSSDSPATFKCNIYF
uniref:Uncharacterized protein n=1 Tax=Helianthus annuus TaxID=4232 RepID=A0A251UEY6_HELAN